MTASALILTDLQRRRQTTTLLHFSGSEDSASLHLGPAVMAAVWISLKIEGASTEEPSMADCFIYDHVRAHRPWTGPMARFTRSRRLLLRHYLTG